MMAGKMPKSTISRREKGLRSALRGVNKAVKIAVCDLGRINAGHEIFVALVDAPIGFVGVVIGAFAVYDLDVETEFTFVPFHQLFLIQSPAQGLLFERFHKMDRSRSEDREGWGLGLYIVKTIICSHGEDISVTSENGMTTFTFTLPLVN